MELERRVRVGVHHWRVPRGSVGGGIGQDHRPPKHASLHLPRRHILSAIYRPLSADVRLLPVAYPYQAVYTGRNVARGIGCCGGKRVAGMGVSQVLRHTGKALAY